MVKIQIDLNKEENDILDAFWFISGEQDKKTALKTLIKNFGLLEPKVKEAIKIKQKR